MRGAVVQARPSRPDLTLWACSALHLVNDAFFAVIYPLLPLLADDLHLGYAEVGLIKTAFSTASSAFQLPVGLLAERWGEFGLLVGGNAWVAAGLIGMGLAGAYLPLLILTVVSGLGGNTQHPLAATLVSRSAPAERRSTAVGTLNFAGDLGKMLGPPLVALVAIPFGWRAALIGLGVFGLVFSLSIVKLPVGRKSARFDQSEGGANDAIPAQTIPPDRALDEAGGPSPAPGQRSSSDRWGIDQPGRFGLLTALGCIDNSTRGGALAFLPFILVAKGLDAAQVSWLFTLVFVGGAAGKFGCGWLGDRFGSRALILLSEGVTVIALVLFPIAPLFAVPLLALAFGFVLNGTSSVLYAMVADLVSERTRARGYGFYYTMVNGSSALAPVLYGVLGDQAGLGAIFVAIAGVNALTLPIGYAVGRARR